MLTPKQLEEMDKRVLNQTDGHYCYEWDGLAVSAWTYEYDCCIDFKKTLRGRVINWFVIKRFNLGWWWHVGRKGRKDLTDF